MLTSLNSNSKLNYSSIDISLNSIYLPRICWMYRVRELLYFHSGNCCMTTAWRNRPFAWMFKFWWLLINRLNSDRYLWLETKSVCSLHSCRCSRSISIMYFRNYSIAKWPPCLITIYEYHTKGTWHVYENPPLLDVSRLCTNRIYSCWPL